MTPNYPLEIGLSYRAVDGLFLGSNSFVVICHKSKMVEKLKLRNAMPGVRFNNGISMLDPWHADRFPYGRLFISGNFLSFHIR